MRLLFERIFKRVGLNFTAMISQRDVQEILDEWSDVLGFGPPIDTWELAKALYPYLRSESSEREICGKASDLVKAHGPAHFQNKSVKKLTTGYVGDDLLDA